MLNHNKPYQAKVFMRAIMLQSVIFWLCGCASYDYTCPLKHNGHACLSEYDVYRQVSPDDEHDLYQKNTPYVVLEPTHDARHVNKRLSLR